MSPALTTGCARISVRSCRSCLVLLAAVFALFVVREVDQRIAARPARPRSPCTAPGEFRRIPNGGRRQPRTCFIESSATAVAADRCRCGGGNHRHRDRRRRYRGQRQQGDKSKRVGAAPQVVAEAAPADFGRRTTPDGDGFAISVPNSWMSVDLSGPDVDATLADLQSTNPEIADYLEQQREVGALPGLFAIETTPAAGPIRPPGQVTVQQLPNEGTSLADGAAELQQLFESRPELVGGVARERVKLPAGNARDPVLQGASAARRATRSYPRLSICLQPSGPST